MNPFGSDGSDSEADSEDETNKTGDGDYDTCLNPFASDVDEDDSGSRIGTESFTSSNPFGNDSDRELDGDVEKDKIKRRAPRPPPKPSIRHSLQPKALHSPSQSTSTKPKRQSMIEEGFR